MRVLKNGDITALFINKKYRVRLNQWMDASCHPTKGFAIRPGFHVLEQPIAPHLKLTKDRAWFEVEIEDFKIIQRPEKQGGRWYLANKMKVVKRHD